jgi:hypothetical protein
MPASRQSRPRAGFCGKVLKNASARLEVSIAGDSGRRETRPRRP